MAISKPLSANEFTPKSPSRHGNQQGSVLTRPAPAPPAVSRKSARLLALYEEDLRLRYGVRTVETYLAQVNAFLSWLTGRGLELTGATRDDLLAHQSELYALRKKDGKPYSASSLASRVKAIRTLYRFLSRRQYLLSDPSAALELPRREQRLPRVILSKDEAKRLLMKPRARTPCELRDRAILETLYGTGIRVSELTALKLDDVDTEELALRVVQGKGRRDRNLPLTRAAARAIEAYLVKGRAALVGRLKLPYLFLGGYGRKLQRATAGKIVTAWAKRARLKKHVTCHVLRHSFATHLLKGKADIRHIQAFLGHKSILSTERYTRVEVSDLQQVLRRAHPRGR